MNRAVAVSLLLVAASCAVCQGASWAITIANPDFEDRTAFTDFMPGVDSGTTRTRNRDAPPGWSMLGWGGRLARGDIG